MTIAAVTKLGSYKITGAIGAGGMGEVYQAHDTKLGRDVAVKVLPEAFAHDPEWLSRFQREAKMLAALNHSNIAAIYGLEEDSGRSYLVMELVAGETLAERVKREGAVPVEEALAICKQIAEGLEAAHEKGIIHRDLKPANVKVTPEGKVKVLDFGLAKAFEGDAANDDPSNSPTLSMAATMHGVILGTAAYMSPEQARGKSVDKRADIWAFGCVLYELLTGKRAFPGETLQDALAAVLEREPDWQAISPAAPAKIRDLVRRCLQKDSQRRLHDIADARIEIDEAISAPAVPVAEPLKTWPPRIWGLARGLLVLGIGVGWMVAHFRQPAAEMRTVRLTVNPPAGTEFHNGAAISPDDRLLAFVSGSSGGDKLWIQSLNSLAARQLPGTDGAALPFWSPDGRSLGFFAADKLKRVDVAGGLPTVICDVGLGRGGSWNAEGIILFNSVNDGPLLRVSAAGGTPTPVTTVDTTHENSHRGPQFLPGGRRFLYFVRADTDNQGVYLGSLDRPQEKIRLLSSATNAVYASDRGKQSGHLFWVRDGALMAQPFDPDEAQLQGEAIVVAEAVGTAAVGIAAVSVSNDGTLFYHGEETRRYQLTWYGRDGKSLGVLDQPERYNALRISPDGKRVALQRIEPVPDVWQIEFARGIPTRVTFSGGVSLGPIWSLDGERIVYSKGAPPNLFSQTVNGVGSEERLIESHDSLFPLDWSLDGRFLLYQAGSNSLSLKTQSGLWLLPTAGDRKPVPFLTAPFREVRGQFSPDAKWIAYTSDESGQNEVYVRSFPAGELKGRVSSKGGDWVRWRRDGKELFYVAPDRKVMSATVRAASGSLEIGSPNALFTLAAAADLTGYSYDVMPDGQRFLVLAPAGEAEAPPMTLILNWQAEMLGIKK
jgi:eukaryotic-like serine/threonine-protein kinase